MDGPVQRLDERSEASLHYLCLEIFKKMCVVGRYMYGGVTSNQKQHNLFPLPSQAHEVLRQHQLSSSNAPSPLNPLHIYPNIYRQLISNYGLRRGV